MQVEEVPEVKTESPSCGRSSNRSHQTKKHRPWVPAVDAFYQVIHLPADEQGVSIPAPLFYSKLFKNPWRHQLVVSRLVPTLFILRGDPTNPPLLDDQAEKFKGKDTEEVLRSLRWVHLVFSNPRSPTEAWSFTGELAEAKDKSASLPSLWMLTRCLPGSNSGYKAAVEFTKDADCKLGQDRSVAKLVLTHQQDRRVIRLTKMASQLEALNVWNSMPIPDLPKPASSDSDDDDDSGHTLKKLLFGMALKAMLSENKDKAKDDDKSDQPVDKDSNKSHGDSEESSSNKGDNDASESSGKRKRVEDEA